jgi:poly(3-hydroxybutyrate) depolymerase
MLYSLHELQRSFLDPVAEWADFTGKVLARHAPVTSRFAVAGTALLHRITRRYPRQPFAIATVNAHGREVAVEEEVVLAEPFCRLLRFARRGEDAATRDVLASDPRVLVVAPLSGHHATLLRDTVATLLRDHDVYVTDWVDARDVPVAAGSFSLSDYVATIQRQVRLLGAEALHVVAVCQPTVPVLAATALMADAGEATPRSLTLMGGPVDARVSPTAVNELATERSLEWFETHMIHRVPDRYAGRGRAVYPGFMQLTAFVMMNPDKHAKAYGRYWLDHVRHGRGAAPARAHEEFYDEYNAVLDMDAAYYLDTVKTVFQDFALARGTWDVGGRRVRPATITGTSLFTVEGANDDISGLGQTEAAHALCSGIPDDRKRHLVAEGCGHYGLFSGRRWRDAIYPEVRSFIRAASAAIPVGGAS